MQGRQDETASVGLGIVESPFAGLRSLADGESVRVAGIAVGEAVTFGWGDGCVCDDGKCN